MAHELNKIYIYIKYKNYSHILIFITTCFSYDSNPVHVITFTRLAIDITGIVLQMSFT